MDVRIITYNVHQFPWISTDVIPAIVQLLTKHADIAVLQEVWAHHEQWQHTFATHGWFLLFPDRRGHIITVGGFGSGLAVAYRPTLWKHTDHRFYPFLTAFGLDSLVSKGWHHTEFLHLPTQTPVRILNVHFQADADVAPDYWRTTVDKLRKEQAQQLYAIESRIQPRIHTLLIGDMNSPADLLPQCPWLTIPRQLRIPTFPSTGQILDHATIFFAATHPWDLQKIHTITEEHSDHYPVLFIIRPIAIPPATANVIATVTTKN